MAVDMESSSASQTLELLEARLKRVAYVLGGHQPERIAQAGTSATQRLKELERALDHIIQRSKVSQDLMKLYASHPELFQQYSTSSDLSAQEVSTKLPIILAAASSYPRTASSLTSITDMTVPSAELSTKIISMKPQLARLEVLQDLQAREIAVLKQRSAAVLQRYYTLDILQAGEYWAEVEAKIEHAEQVVRRATRLKELDKGIM